MDDLWFRRNPTEQTFEQRVLMKWKSLIEKIYESFKNEPSLKIRDASQIPVINIEVSVFKDGKLKRMAFCLRSDSHYIDPNDESKRDDFISKFKRVAIDASSNCIFSWIQYEENNFALFPYCETETQ